MRRFTFAKWGVVMVALMLFTTIAWRLRTSPLQQVPTPLVRVSASPTLPSPAIPPLQPAPAVTDAVPAPASATADPYGMPPPSPDQIRPVPEPPVVTAQDHQATRQAARELVENGITRLANEGQKAERSGDTETAQRNQIRIARLRKRLAALQQETSPPAEEK